MRFTCIRLPARVCRGSRGFSTEREVRDFGRTTARRAGIWRFTGGRCRSRETEAIQSTLRFLYAEGFPSGFELSQIVLRFDSELPDTSSAEDEIQKNVFRLRTNDDTVWEEYLPAIPANRSYYIYPKRGFPELYYSLEVAPMYACNCGGSVDLIFTKVN